MVKKIVIRPERVRKIWKSFAFIEHRFLQEDFFIKLSHHELLLYFFLILAGDRDGLSFYGYDRICSLLKISLDDYILARDNLIKNDLIAFDGRFFQVLSLPDKPPTHQFVLLSTKEDMLENDPATIRQIILRSIGEKP